MRNKGITYYKVIVEFKNDGEVREVEVSAKDLHSILSVLENTENVENYRVETL